MPASTHLDQPRAHSRLSGSLNIDLNQLLEVQRLVQDVIPPGTVAIGDDGYGNLVLLRFADGSIEFWDHERELNDFATETICPSFAAYLEFLTISPVLDSQ